MARVETVAADHVYRAATQWFDRCLRLDDSLFTPGRAIWTTAIAEDLHERFVRRPDESDRDFMTKFRDQLAGADVATVQLAAEMLFVHFLILKPVSGDKKREIIAEVLSWAPSEVGIPADLTSALDHGLCRGGTAYNTQRPFLLAIIVEFARRWKALSPADRDTALSDPWEFKRVLFEVTGHSALLQQHALLHLAFPDTFEAIVADGDKHGIARAFAKHVTDPDADVDRRLLEIRRAITAETGEPPKYYGPYGEKLWIAPEHLDTRYWKIAPGDNAWQWEECKRDGFIAIGWEAFGDLTDLDAAGFEQARARVMKEHGWKKGTCKRVWQFRNIRPGDRIVANRGTTQVLGIGTVTGPYYYVEGRHAHRLPVEWDDVEPRAVVQGGWRKTMIELSREKFEQIVAAPPLGDGVGVPVAPPPGPPDDWSDDDEDTDDAVALPAVPAQQPPYPLDVCARDTHLAEALLARWLSALNRKGQAVFYGPPGTGKTFVATCLARHIVGGTDGFVRIVQFHPSYAYEDFVEGIRPTTASGSALAYSIVPGRFVEFCEEARRRTGPCVLILDEINRANLSRVFGELMFLLEYRDKSVALAGGRQFSVPANVRIIGTMNTADRSVALVDHALRRRFAFLALYPDFEVLRKFHGQEDAALIDRLVDVLADLNKRIGDRHYEVGVSFFLQRELATHLEDIWRMEIEPYVEEYFFDQPDRVEAVRWHLVRTKLGL